MHLQDLRRWLREKNYPEDGILEAQPAILSNHRLVWNYHSKARRGAAANIEACPGHDLWGLVLKINGETLKGIDHKEGHPHRYHRGDCPQPLTRLDTGEIVEAWVYKVLPEFTHDTLQTPRRPYIDLMREAATEYGAPKTYLDALNQIPVLES